MKIGVLALQGAVREHMDMIERCGAKAIEVKNPEDLDNIDGLIIPGGESSSIGLLLSRNGLKDEIINKFRNGMPIYGTCAGAILLAKKIIGRRQHHFGCMDIAVERNSYGRQIDSFETELEISDIGHFKGIFIRAPIIKEVFNGARIMASFRDNPVMIRQDNILITTFHPELTKDPSIHRYFLNMIKESNK